jgi:putative radical SAM enzyme (TIGR03279 family)
MPLFQELDPTTFHGGQITGIQPRSLAAKLGLRPGDELLAINDQAVEDIIDVQFYGADEELTLLIRRDGEMMQLDAQRPYNQPLGIEFSHPTFDTDIRRCNNLCGFCFVLQMAPKFRRTLYIKDDDYRYSFLFGHYVTLTNLTEHDWWRIRTMRLSPLYVSVHVTDTTMRRAYLGNPRAPEILAQLRQLAEWDIELHTQLVVTPGVNDGRILEQSISDLAELWPAVQSISVVPVGLTKQHKYGMRPHTPAEATVTLDYVESLQPIYQAKFGVRFVYPTDEWYLVTGRPVPQLDAYDGQELYENGLGMVRRFLNEWQEVQREITPQPTPRYQSITLATATLFAPTLQQTAVQFSQLSGIPTHIIPIINQRLGATITVAGLLMAQDVIAHLQAQPLGELLVLPRVMFDHPDTISMDDLTPQEVANRLQRPIALADSMGDVWDALIGQSALLYTPGKPGGSLSLRVLHDDDLSSNTHLS